MGREINWFLDDVEKIREELEDENMRGKVSDSEIIYVLNGGEKHV